MEIVEIHPNLKDKIKVQELSWFLYCTSAYTDAGQEEIIKSIRRRREHLAWKATRSGYVLVAVPSMNLHITTPSYTLHKNFTIECSEKAIIDHAWKILNTGDPETKQQNILHLIWQMRQFQNKVKNLQIPMPSAHDIGKNALIQAGYWIFDCKPEDKQ
jgi:hypothetical protein